MRTLPRLLLGLLVLGLGACQSWPATGGGARSGAPERLQRIIDAGELRVGLTGDQPPLNMRNERGETVGFEVDIVKALASSMGLQLQLVEKPFADLLPALERGDVDLVISGVSITPERNVRVAFAGPYFVSGKSILSKSSEIANARTIAALDQPGRIYAALSGSTSEAFVKALLPHGQLVPVPDYDTGVKQVMSGTADGLVADYPVCLLTVLRYPNAGLAAIATPLTIEPLGIALPPDSPLLVNLVENYLATLEYTGVLSQLKAYWFSDGPWVSELP
jgi:ABC-type amino acid transport substrate-binding protein